MIFGASNSAIWAARYPSFPKWNGEAISSGLWSRPSVECLRSQLATLSIWEDISVDLQGDVVDQCIDGLQAMAPKTKQTKRFLQHGLQTSYDLLNLVAGLEISITGGELAGSLGVPVCVDEGGEFRGQLFDSG